MIAQQGIRVHKGNAGEGVPLVVLGTRAGDFYAGLAYMLPDRPLVLKAVWLRLRFAFFALCVLFRPLRKGVSWRFIRALAQ